MKRLVGIGCVLVFLCVSSRAQAVGRAVNVLITMVDVRDDGLFLINLSSPIGAGPACANITNRMSANANTAGGKALLQVALSAFLGMKRVNVEGTGTCNEYKRDTTVTPPRDGIESLKLLQMH